MVMGTRGDAPPADLDLKAEQVWKPFWFSPKIKNVVAVDKRAKYILWNFRKPPSESHFSFVHFYSLITKHQSSQSPLSANPS